jgi:SpoIID/LytB domain protein
MASSVSDRRAAFIAPALVMAMLTALVVMAGSIATAPPAAAASDVLPVSGHGWGHGRGMSQYGAYGYVHDLGVDPGTVLNHYYSNTTPGQLPGGLTLGVRLMAHEGAPLEVTSAASFTVGNIFVPAGWASQLFWNGFGWTITTEPGCGAAVSGTTTVTDPTFRSTVDPGDDLTKMLNVCEAGGPHAYRGYLFGAWDGTQHAVNVVWIEDYVRAVVPREMPASWPIPVLQVQAIAARSYGWAENRYAYAKTCDTTSCQVYGGAGKNGARLEAPNSDTATFGTLSGVRVFGNGVVASTEFSSSSGGYTAGGTFPAVPDDGDATPINPNHNWSTTLSTSAIANFYGVGAFLAISVPVRNGLGDGGGRALTVTISGTAKSVSVSGTSFQATWGLKSDWFFFPMPPPQFFLRNSNSSGSADGVFNYGNFGDVPMLCDWNGDGFSTMGVFRNGVFYLRNSNSTGGADVVFPYGNPGDIPVCGHWNGGATDTVGVYRAGVFYLRLSNTAGVADLVVPFGNAGDTPVVGDWGATGKTTVGVFRAGTWYVQFTNRGGNADAVFGFGNSTDTPIAGDWNAAGRARPGVVRNATWYLGGSWPPSGVSDYAVFGYGDPGDIPLTGDYDGNGTDTPGIARGYR